VWGGEFLLGDAADYARVAHVRPFRLPGGEAAVREPRRTALALLLESRGPSVLSRGDLESVGAFTRAECDVLARMLARGVNAPVTTSAGRLFDAVASLLGLVQRSAFEGQAAMAVEAAALAAPAGAGAYPFPLVEREGAPTLLDWEPLVDALLEDRAKGTPAGVMAARFHAALADGIVAVAQRAGSSRVALTGGCFQNKLLTEQAAQRLQAAGFQTLLHAAVPPNDGGIGVGQVLVAAAHLKHLHRKD